MILDEVKEAYVKDLLTKDRRGDGRKLMEYRPIKIDKNVFSNCEGSAIAHLGDSKVVAGIKFDVMEPFKDRPDEGVVMVNSEFSPIAHPEFNPGPPDENSIELARVVDRGIRSAEVVDVTKLSQSDGKVLGIFIDLYIIDNSGNLIDTAALAAMSALSCTKVPKYEEGGIIRNEFIGKLELQRKVVTSSFEKINGKMLLDANDGEEVASSGRITFATSEEDFICATQKSGMAGFTEQELDFLMDSAIEKGKELRKLV